ncbi:MAG: TMEM165/GDT1 family protein [Acidimicrobiales bacterium]|jgi:putative Ca2+/H+ antiporter (TMEM165/GDT1 family)|nr:TMEM165/GDT1 family protein [Acidimicrobiales bacterium]
MSFTEVLRAFATVFPAELPDKTMIATVVLVARYRRPLWVWLGAVGAFTIHVTVAVAAGSAIGLLPEALVGAVVAAMFATGSVLLFRSARSHADAADRLEPAVEPTRRAALVGSFGLVALAEWGDLTQLATAGLAARSDAPFAVWLGALAALASVAALAAAFGRQIIARVPIHRINYVASAVFGALAVWTLIELL